MISILLLCSANLCRSPMAEEILKAQLEANGLGDRVFVRSAGVKTESGLRVHRLARAALQAAGLQGCEEHRSCAFSSELSQTDIILTATTAIRDTAVSIVPSARDRSFAWLEFLALASGVLELSGVSAQERCLDLLRQARQHRGIIRPRTPEAFDVGDPIGRPAAAYTLLVDEIDRSMASLAALLSLLFR